MTCLAAEFLLNQDRIVARARNGLYATGNRNRRTENGRVHERSFGIGMCPDESTFSEIGRGESPRQARACTVRNAVLLN